ncbi:Lrp/AsnC family transcriptional regulator [Microbaculum marinum]|uniref:Lrp/AsnC family transcriptional regulator n=1 Tax=Microbaculum marinum TaxID=1764581 RepID=A0AAW9RDJ6_9HYPH
MRQPELDDRDRAILRALQEDGRLSNTDLADRVGLSPSACLRRVRILEESGLVAGYAMILDQKAFGFPGTAFVSITLDQQGRQALDAFESAVRAVPEIPECHLLAGQSDYLVRVVYRDAADLERIHTEILTRLPGVVRITSTLALREVKKTTRLPV